VLGRVLNKRRFENLLLKAVDESLCCLGDSVKRSIYFYLENSFGMRKNNIPKELEVFSKNLEALFKDGSYYIERLIVKRLYEILGLDFEQENDFSFIDYVNKAKFFYTEQKKMQIKTKRGRSVAKRSSSQ